MTGRHKLKQKYPFWVSTPVRALPVAEVGFSQTITADSPIVVTRVFGTATITVGFTISPASIVRTRAFGTAVVSRGNVTVVAPSIVRTRAFGTATVNRGNVNIAPGSIVRTRVFPIHTVSTAGGGGAAFFQDSFSPGAPLRGKHDQPKIRR